MSMVVYMFSALDGLWAIGGCHALRGLTSILHSILGGEFIQFFFGGGVSLNGVDRMHSRPCVPLLPGFLRLLTEGTRVRVCRSCQAFYILYRTLRTSNLCPLCHQWTALSRVYTEGRDGRTLLTVKTKGKHRRRLAGGLQGRNPSV